MLGVAQELVEHLACWWSSPSAEAEVSAAPARAQLEDSVQVSWPTTFPPSLELEKVPPRKGLLKIRY